MLKREAFPVEEALARHRGAVAAFVASAAATDSDAWTRPTAPGKWSPAQVTEHLLLAVLAVQAELQQRSPMRFVLPAWKRFLLRRAVLPRLLATGRFPAGARAPREIRPSLPTISQEEALRRLESAAAEFDAACRQAPRLEKRRLGHPYFGALPATDLIRILAWHTLHHRVQLPGVEQRPFR
jgi:hypothetical protein